MQSRIEYLTQVLLDNPNVSSGELFTLVKDHMSQATVKRELNQMINLRIAEATGNGKSRKYSISKIYAILRPVNIKDYFSIEIDDRQIIRDFNFDVFDLLEKYPLFTAEESHRLEAYHQQFLQNIKDISPIEYEKELERLAIDLSWKSAQIEGNTYTLLETERLLRDKQTASGKTKDEAIMLLNHKTAIDFLVSHTDYLSPLTRKGIENIHALLIHDLGVERNIRRRRVGISGTNYKPLDNEFQIIEALERTCAIINAKQSIFEKALIALVMLSYMQPFADGNKRTARIVSNAIFIHAGYCPISFRTVDPIDYKMAMLLFYEQNNISVIKDIFISQVAFAVDSYF